MTDERDVRSQPLLDNFRSGKPYCLRLATFLGSWSGEFDRAWVIGSREDIKLLAEFGTEDGFAISEPSKFPMSQLGSYLRSAFREKPRGYLCLPFTGSEFGIRLLRFTQISQLGGSKGLSYRLSAPSGVATSFDPYDYEAEVARLRAWPIL